MLELVDGLEGIKEVEVLFHQAGKEEVLFDGFASVLPHFLSQFFIFQNLGPFVRSDMVK